MAGFAAFGSVFCIGSTTTASGAVAELTGISGPGVSADTIDVSSHGSTDAYRNFVAGLIDGGEISLEGNLTSATAGNVIMTAISARSTTMCLIKYPTGVVWSFVGIPTGFECDAPHDGKLGFSASVKVTGRPTLSS